MEASRERERDQLSEAQKEFMCVQSRLEFERHSLSESTREIEVRLSAERSKNLELTAQLKSGQSKLKAASEHLKRELEDYKAKVSGRGTVSSLSDSYTLAPTIQPHQKIRFLDFFFSILNMFDKKFFSTKTFQKIFFFAEYKRVFSAFIFKKLKTCNLIDLERKKQEV